MDVIPIAVGLICFWAITAAALLVWKKTLFQSTWTEPYCDHVMLAIESDDWGPGPAWHAERLRDISDRLRLCTDTRGKPLPLSANLILSIPDIERISAGSCEAYERVMIDTVSPDVVSVIRDGNTQGTIASQLHGAEHYYGPGFFALKVQGDERLAELRTNIDATQWENVDSGLQAHFVDGSSYPTAPVERSQQREQISIAVDTINRVFDCRPKAAVAPCYLWNDDTEQLWSDAGIEFIQTAGYRCSGRDANGHYQQDAPLIRLGDRNRFDQIYLVRNAMYEPKDGRTVDSCLAEARRAFRQRLPIVISTHRYNYTDADEAASAATDGLIEIIEEIGRWSETTSFVDSTDIGIWCRNMSNDRVANMNPLRRVHGFLARLWYRHAKLRVAACLTLLIVPLGIAYAISWSAHRMTSAVGVDRLATD